MFGLALIRESVFFFFAAQRLNAFRRPILQLREPSGTLEMWRLRVQATVIPTIRKSYTRDRNNNCTSSTMVPHAPKCRKMTGGVVPSCITFELLRGFAIQRARGVLTTTQTHLPIEANKTWGNLPHLLQGNTLLDRVM